MLTPAFVAYEVVEADERATASNIENIAVGWFESRYRIGIPTHAINSGLEARQVLRVWIRNVVSPRIPNKIIECSRRIDSDGNGNGIDGVCV